MLKSEIQLRKEYERWVDSHPEGFSAEPRRSPGNKLDFYCWDCVVPGLEGTDWEGGRYKFSMLFQHAFPVLPPSCLFSPMIVHPNIITDALLLHPLFQENRCWRPTMTIEDMLKAIQNIFHTPAIEDELLNSHVWEIYSGEPERYSEIIRLQALHTLQPMYKSYRMSF